MSANPNKRRKRAVRGGWALELDAEAERVAGANAARAIAIAHGGAWTPHHADRLSLEQPVFAISTPGLCVAMDADIHRGQRRKARVAAGLGAASAPRASIEPMPND